MLTNESITFGKYKGYTLEHILKDRSYCSWLLEQDWFQNGYEYIYNRVKDYKTEKYYLKDIIYKDYKITYWLTTENITVHADKDRIRENFKVQLTTKVPDNLEKDILEEFCKHCVSEYVKSLSTTTSD
jgi:hypothetical protein